MSLHMVVRGAFRPPTVSLHTGEEAGSITFSSFLYNSVMILHFYTTTSTPQGEGGIPLWGGGGRRGATMYTYIYIYVYVHVCIHRT